MTTARGLRVLGVLTGSLVGCAAATHQSPASAPHAAVLMNLTPRIAFISPMSSGVRVQATVRIHNPSEAHRCSAELWEWGDGERSFHAEDCRPEDLEPWTSDAPLVLTSRHIYRGPYKGDVTLTLMDARGVVARVSTTLQIIYPGEKPE